MEVDTEQGFAEDEIHYHTNPASASETAIQFLSAANYLVSGTTRKLCRFNDGGLSCQLHL